MNESQEGWAFVLNAENLTRSRKWHYFVNKRSLCNRYMLFSNPTYEQGNDDSPDNCAECRRRLKKRQGSVNAG